MKRIVTSSSGLGVKNWRVSAKIRQKEPPTGKLCMRNLNIKSRLWVLQTRISSSVSNMKIRYMNWKHVSPSLNKRFKNLTFTLNY